MNNFKDLTGKIYYDLTVKSRLGKTRQGGVIWSCECICGNLTTATTGQLNYGSSKSCGCRRGESHGESNKSRLYQVWKNMNGRCYTVSSTHYERYGGRGISVCSEWRSSYSKFKVWALQNGYKDSLTIDRIVIEGNYEPGNCRFIPGPMNTSLMNYHHIQYKTGPHSIEKNAKVKSRNRENLGHAVVISKDNVEIKFNSVGAAAEHLSRILEREYKNVYSHAKQVANGKYETLTGWRIVKCVQ